MYFALINLQSCNWTVGCNRIDTCNQTVTWANHLKCSPLNPPITRLITIAINRTLFVKLWRFSLQWLRWNFNYDIKMTIRAIIVSSHFDIVLCPYAHSDSNVFHRKLIKDNPTPNQNQSQITLRASILSRSNWSRKKTLLLYLKYMQ